MHIQTGFKVRWEGGGMGQKFIPCTYANVYDAGMITR